MTRNAFLKRMAVMLLTLILASLLVGCGEKVAAGDEMVFGNYHDDQIWWNVLAIKDDKALIISQDILDWKLFNEEAAETTWEDSSLRIWLNDEFYYTAFTTEERERIVETTIENPGNFEFNIESGNDTVDKIFLLSSYEVEEYFEQGYGRAAYLSNYAEDSAENYVDWYIGGLQHARWWTRTAGDSSSSFTCVSDEGEFVYHYATIIPENGFDVGITSSMNEEDSSKIQAVPVVPITTDTGNGAGVRPAMWITLD